MKGEKASKDENIKDRVVKKEKKNTIISLQKLRTKIS